MSPWYRRLGRLRRFRRGVRLGACPGVSVARDGSSGLACPIASTTPRIVWFVVLEEPTCARDQGTAGQEASRRLSIGGRSSDCGPMRVVGSLEPRDRIGAAAALDGVGIEGPSQPLHFVSSSASDRRQDSLDRAGTPPCVEDINVTIHGETLQTRPPAGGQHREYLSAGPGRQSRPSGMPPVVNRTLGRRAGSR